jgi:hypothetical protein
MSFPKKKKLVLKIDLDSQEYLDSLTKHYDFSDLIYFHEKNALCGSFDNHYGLFTVSDYSKKNKNKNNTLKSIVEILKGYHDHASSSIFNFPHLVQKMIKETFETDSKEYVSNYKIIKDSNQGTFIAVNEIQKMPEWFEGFDKWEKHTCSESKLSTFELIEVIQYMTYHSQSESLFKEYYENVNNAYLRMFNDSISTPSLEKPIYVHLSGNDDCSYGKVVGSMEDAKMIYDILLKEGRTTNLRVLIKKLGFIFTN